ncbi:MAG: hypothetical protein O7B23_13890, partial [Deltaproteobacteria bacterium]|nr:hypothetical protein [Deltaproteobacteria bacterium]
MASMIASLRVHLFELQTRPVWNFMFCGGRPELAVPFSWAYTWPSLFGYAFAPVHAIIAAWIALSLVGLLAAKSLFESWSGSRSAAWVGAILYVAGGSFSARFNAGHVTFAFHHLVPLLMLLFERGFARRVEGERAASIVALSTLAAFGFFTSALPHGLIYFYPAWLLLVAVRIATADVGLRRSLRAAAPLLMSHVLGLWIAAYKFWPILRWQLGAPRQSIPEERYGLVEILANHLLFVREFEHAGTQAWHVLPSWGYNAYLGPFALGLALFALVALAARWRGWRPQPVARVDPVAGGFAALLALIGIDLALGNASPVSVSSWFRHIPVLEAVRGFNRYQILVVFAIASLASIGFAVLQRWWHPGRLRTLVPVLALATVAPVLVEATLQVYELPNLPNSELLKTHRGRQRAEIPQLIGVVARSGLRWKRFRGVGAQTALIQQGYWISNCATDLDLATPVNLHPGVRSPLSSPEPLGVVEHSRDRLTLQLPTHAKGQVTLHLSTLDGFEFNAPIVARGRGVSFRLEDLPEGQLRIRA